MASSNSSSENSVAARAVILAFMLLGGLFVAVMFLESHLSKLLGKFADEAVTGLMLLCLWLVVGSTIRAINRLAKGVQSWKLLLSGVLTAMIASLLTTAFLAVFPEVAKSENMHEVAGATGGLILLMTSLAFIVSLLVVINLRMKNKALGKVLELLLVVGCILAFVYFASR